MKIKVCDREFNTEEIKDINITQSSVLIDTEDEFYRIRYTNEEDLKEVRTYLKFKTLKKEELLDAIRLLITVCDYFINSKTQCLMCPLKRTNGCLFNSNPIDWRN